MTSSPTQSSTPCYKPEVKKALYHSQTVLTGHQAIKGVTRACFILGIALLELLYTPVSRFVGISRTLVWIVGVPVAIVMVVRIVMGIAVYVSCCIFNTSISLTAVQRKLLGIKDTEPGVTTAVPPKTSASSGDSPINYTPWSHSPSLSASQLSSPGSSMLSSSTVGFSTTCDSFSFQQQQQQVGADVSQTSPTAQDTLRRRLFNTRTTMNLEDSIRDETSLRHFMMDHSRTSDLDLSRSGAGASFLGSASAGTTSPRLPESSPVAFSALGLSPRGYQLSTRSPQRPAAKTNDTSSSDALGGAGQVWEKLGIPEWRLERWLENLRHWLNITVLRRVTSQIDTVNEQLRKAGHDNMLIGEASVSSLKQLTVTKGDQIRHLNSVIAFIDTTGPQDYIVSRIKELEAGRCISDYSWKAGGVYKGKAWSDHLPTDTALMLHLLCTYLDTRLPSLPRPLGDSPFTKFHFLSTPQKPDLTRKEQLVLYVSSVNPPQSQLIVDNEIWSPVQGRNNMFETILLFFYMLKTKESGMLGPVSLGKAGLNVAWVIDR